MVTICSHSTGHAYISHPMFRSPTRTSSPISGLKGGLTKSTGLFYDSTPLL
jgi:hypothetical protein